MIPNESQCTLILGPDTDINGTADDLRLFVTHKFDVFAWSSTSALILHMCVLIVHVPILLLM